MAQSYILKQYISNASNVPEFMLKKLSRHLVSNDAFYTFIALIASLLCCLYTKKYLGVRIGNDP